MAAMIRWRQLWSSACAVCVLSTACTKQAATPPESKPTATPTATPDSVADRPRAAPEAAPIQPAAREAPVAIEAPEPTPAAAGRAKAPARVQPAAANKAALGRETASSSSEPAPARTPDPVASTPTAAEPQPSPCGEKGQPRCPLQGWMEDHLQSALDKEDLPTLARALGRVASFVPDPSWNAGAQGWSVIANSGVDAAKRGDSAATRLACKTCHKAWRSKYKDAFRQRVLPK
jgi:hypothetical protein